MLNITIPSTEQFNEQTMEFVYTDEYTLSLEHSLVSVSKWESKWCKPFLSNDNKTEEEIVDYVKCMTLTPNVPDEVYSCLSSDNLKSITDYLKAPMTATFFNETQQKQHNNEQITSELIYYWMIALNIPFECENWHLTRLLTLIRVCNVKNQPPKKMSRQELIARNKALNAARRNKYKSKG